MLNSNFNRRTVKSRSLAGKTLSLLLILFAAGLTSSRAQDTWTQKADFGGIERVGAAGFSVNSKVYIGTGFDITNLIYLTDFWEWDPTTNAWTQKADFTGEARWDAAGFAIGDKGYLGIGQGSVYDKDFYEYDPASNIWTKKANFGGVARLDAVAFTIGNKGYIGTGGAIIQPKSDFWEYNPTNNTWTQKADFGGGVRVHALGFAIGNKGYIGMGTFNDYLTDFWEYDPSTNIWTQKADFGGTARTNAVGFSIGTKGYVGTGSTHNHTLLKDFWEYNPDADAWVQKGDFGGTARQQAVGISTGSKGYIGTGSTCANGCFENDFWEYSAEQPSITTGSITGSPFCPEEIVDVPFTSIGTYNAGNVYTAELSDKLGSFAVPTPIGTLTSNANSGTIAATVPSKPTAGTKYRIRVTSSNPAVTGSANGSNLKLIACKKVTSLSATSITASSAMINWTGVSCTAKHRIQYRKQGTSSWTNKYSTSTSYIITGLMANTIYEYHIETYCSESGSSNSGYTTIQTFTTAMRLSSGSVAAGEMMNIYPNPAEDHATIQFSLSQSSPVDIKVYDVSGKEIATLLNDNIEKGEYSVLLNTTEFSKGVYFVKMISDFGIENQKLIVQ